MKPLTILKIGGKLIDDETKLQSVLTDFSKTKTDKILVHGGGEKTSQLCRQLGIEPKMWNGRRITDAATLEVATMVYAGLINKKLVSRLQSFNCNAMGFSGADGNVILAKKREGTTVDFGFAGDIQCVNKQLIINMLDTGIAPVFNAITHNGKGQLLNTNADTIATTLATSLAADYRVSLIYCFEKNGVLLHPDDDTTVIQQLSYGEYLEHQQKGTITDGMIPKLDNAFAAKKAHVSKVLICGTTGVNGTNGTEICL